MLDSIRSLDPAPDFLCFVPGLTSAFHYGDLIDLVCVQTLKAVGNLSMVLLGLIVAHSLVSSDVDVTTTCLPKLLGHFIRLGR